MDAAAATGSPGWSLILLRESAILTTASLAVREPGGVAPSRPLRILRRRHSPPAGLRHELEFGLGFAFPVSSLPYLLSLLDNVQRCREYADFVERQGVEAGAWSAPQFHDGMVRVFGPVIAHSSREAWTPAASVELEYLTIADLHSNLHTVTSVGPLRPAPPGLATADDTKPVLVLSVLGVHDYREVLSRERAHSARVRLEATRNLVTIATMRSRRLAEVSARLRAQAHALRRDLPTGVGESSGDQRGQ